MKILNRVIAISIISIGLYISLLYTSVMAAYNDFTIVSPTATGSDIALPPINDMSNSGSIIGGIISWFIAITAVLAIISITWAAIQMVLAVGEDEKIKKARYTMIYSFIGLIVAGLAYGTVRFVTNLDLNSFL